MARQIAVVWTPDCQGKWDFDGPVISVSTRLWPRGGGYSMFTPGAGWEENADRPDVRPSAHCSIVLNKLEGDYETLVEAHFGADTEQAVKAQVEAWVDAMCARIVRAVQVAVEEDKG